MSDEYRDTNVGERFYRDTPEEREIERLTHQLARLRAEVQALREDNNDLHIGRTEALSLLKSLHEWFIEKAPEHYKGCGLWIDVDITLKAYADEAEMERSAE